MEARDRSLLGDHCTLSRIAAFSGVPTIYSALLDVPVGDNDISSLEFALCGAAPMPAQIDRALRSEDRPQDRGGLWPHRGALASPRSIRLRRKARRLDRPAPALPANAASCMLDAAGRFDRVWQKPMKSERWSSGGRTCSPAISTRAQQGPVDRDRWRDAGSTPAISAARMVRRLFLARRPTQGAHHQRRTQHRSEADRGRLAQTPLGRLGCRRRQPRRLCRRGPCRLCPDSNPAPPSAEQELIDFAARPPSRARGHPEAREDRAALPLTAIGKIFKPALQEQEIESVVRSEAETAGVPILSFALDRDPQHGVVVRVRAGRGAKLQEALDRYAFRSVVQE